MIEVFGTARVLRRFGLTTALLALPVTGALGTLALSFDAALWIVAAVMVAERVVAFALANPAIKVIYTLATPDEKYKVQNFIDTVVFRGGDATSGWLYAFLGGGRGFRCEYYGSGRDADGARVAFGGPASRRRPPAARSRDQLTASCLNVVLTELR